MLEILKVLAVTLIIYIFVDAGETLLNIYSEKEEV